MRIGILTLHDGINYGSFFQVYALQNFLLGHGFECQVINYKSLGFTWREYKVFLDPRRVPIRRIARNTVKIAKFRIAQRRLHLTRRIFRADAIAKLHFDRLVIGSDEVWNFGTRLIGYDPVYFSQGLNADRIISYAASFGSTRADEPFPEQLRDLLGRVDCISVRDENSASIIRAIGRKPVHVVLDPCFLVDLRPEAIAPTEREFILVYGHFSKTMADQIVKYARLMGRKTVSVGYRYPWCDVNLDTLSPFAWLGYFLACDCVITTMFHGTVFSLLSQKDFCVFSTPYRTNKIGNLLSEVGLPNRFVGEDAFIKDTFAEKIDYPAVNARIEAKRRQSEEFLLGALQS
jgi:polysaccharide pyruvyl transferase WcaK-like protein